MNVSISLVPVPSVRAVVQMNGRWRVTAPKLLEKYKQVGPLEAVHWRDVVLYVRLLSPAA